MWRRAMGHSGMGSLRSPPGLFRTIRPGPWPPSRGRDVGDQEARRARAAARTSCREMISATSNRGGTTPCTWRMRIIGGK